MTESQEQMLLVEKCRNYDWRLKEAGLKESGIGRLLHVPNGGLRTKSEAAKLKAMGVVAGAADIFVPVPSGGWHGLWIEMKQGAGRVAKVQEEFGQAMIDAGYAWAACWGHEEAWRVVCNYMGINE